MQCPHCFREIHTNGACPYCGYDPAGDAEKYPLALKPGSILNGRYILGHVLGQGGFGITYIAWDENMKERVAIKEYLPAEFAGRSTGSPSVQVYSGDRAENFSYGKEQFLEEAKTLAAFIGDSHIVRIYSYFEENSTAYFCMEYVDGLPLDKYMAARGGRLSLAEANRLLLPLMESLETVHAKGVVHRDIAPDNILVTKDGTAKLIDFGAARYSTGEKSKSLDVILKHGFAPKEQYMRRARQGPWTDVYAMAATWYYAVTGRIPPEAIERIDEENLVPPSSLGVRLGDTQEDALYKALAVSAAERFQSMGEFRRAMAAASDTQSAAAAPVEKTVFLSEPPAASAAKPEPTKKKSKLPLLLGAAAVLAAVIFGVTRLTGGESAAVRETAAPAPLETPAPTTDPQETAYAEAEAYLQDGLPHKAWSVFHALGDYRDAQARADQIAYEMRVKNSKAIATGGPIPGSNYTFTVGKKDVGTVVFAGSDEGSRRNISEWTDIVSVSAGSSHVVGLRSDGTVVMTSVESKYSSIYTDDSGQINVSDWSDIVAIAAGGSNTVGLKADGTVVTTNYCDVADWTDIVAVATGGSYIVGLKADGTVVAVGSSAAVQREVSGWTDIVVIDAGFRTVGVKADGTVVAVGYNDCGQCNVSDWTDIVSVAQGFNHTIGLKADGTVVAVGDYSLGQTAIQNYTGIVAIAAAENHSVGLRADGTVVATGSDKNNECLSWTDIAPAK